jgi:uncharacterized protein
MHIAITGSTGFLGSALTASLIGDGHTVTRIVRSEPSSPHELRWDIERRTIDADGLRGVDAVVHLAGEGIAEGRWTDERKRRILESRTKGTSLIAETLAALDDGPRTLISVSGINFYGDRGDEVLTEDSGPGDQFLTEVTKQWEAAADPAREAGIRVVHPRIGIVQSPEGGALAKLLPLFKLGIGGRFGLGRHYWSWISLDDVLGVFRFALETTELSGPVNAVAPNPVTNAEYTKTLARVLHRPAVLPVPPFGPAVLLGRELTQELLFTSARILPERLEAAGFAFRHTNLEQCLRDVLDRPADAEKAADHA